MTVEPRSRVTAFIGPSGCGKSTFLRTSNRMHEVTPGGRVEGKVLLDDEDLYGHGIDPVAVRRTIGMVFQRPNPFPTMSIFDNVAAGLRLNGSYKKSELNDVVEKSLKGANLSNKVKDRLNKPGSGLWVVSSSVCASRGRSRWSRRSSSWTSPASALDPISTLAIEDLIGELKERFTIVIVTHNMQQAARVSDRTTFLNLAAVGQPGRHRDRRHGAHLLQPVGAGHGGLHLRPLRLSRFPPYPSRCCMAVPPRGREGPAPGSRGRARSSSTRTRTRAGGQGWGGPRVGAKGRGRSGSVSLPAAGRRGLLAQIPAPPEAGLRPAIRSAAGPVEARRSSRPRDGASPRIRHPPETFDCKPAGADRAVPRAPRKPHPGPHLTARPTLEDKAEADAPPTPALIFQPVLRSGTSSGVDARPPRPPARASSPSGHLVKARWGGRPTHPRSTHPLRPGSVSPSGV